LPRATSEEVSDYGLQSGSVTVGDATGAIANAERFLSIVEESIETLSGAG